MPHCNLSCRRSLLMRTLILGLFFALVLAPVAIPERAYAADARLTRATRALNNLCIKLDGLTNLLNLLKDLQAIVSAGLFGSILPTIDINPACIGFDFSLDARLSSCLSGAVSFDTGSFSCNYQLPRFSVDVRAALRECLPRVSGGVTLPTDLSSCVAVTLPDITARISSILDFILSHLNFGFDIGSLRALLDLKIVCQDFRSARIGFKRR